MTILSFTVPGQARAKQSFIYATGKSHIDPDVQAWQDNVGWYAKFAMAEKPMDMFVGPVKLWAEFFLKDGRRIDCDNLLKAVMDGCKGVVFSDDSQVYNVCAWKRMYSKDPHVEITVQELEEAQP